MAKLIILSNKMRYQKWKAGLALGASRAMKKLPNRTGRTWGGIGGLRHVQAARGVCGVPSGTLSREENAWWGRRTSELEFSCMRAFSLIPQESKKTIAKPDWPHLGRRWRAPARPGGLRRVWGALR